MIILTIALFLILAIETEKQLISTALYNFFEGDTVPKPIPVSIPVSRLCLDHPIKRMRSKEEILSWLLSNTPKSLPSKIIDRFYLNDEWRVRYQTLPLEEMSLKQLKELAIAFDVKPQGNANLKASWSFPILEAEQASLAGFLVWSDRLARSLKS